MELEWEHDQYDMAVKNKFEKFHVAMYYLQQHDICPQVLIAHQCLRDDIVRIRVRCHFAEDMLGA
jgi:hypothetical protein